MQSREGTTASSRTTLASLFKVPDARFLDAAYQALLNRAPDSVGLAHYSQMLRRGVSRRRIIRDLASSKSEPCNLLPGLIFIIGPIRYFRLSLTRMPHRNPTYGAKHSPISHPTEPSPPSPGAPQSATGCSDMPPDWESALKSIETRLLQRHEALIAIYSDNIERELGVLRTMILDNRSVATEDSRRAQSHNAHSPMQATQGK